MSALFCLGGRGKGEEEIFLSFLLSALVGCGGGDEEEADGFVLLGLVGLSWLMRLLIRGMSVIYLKGKKGKGRERGGGRG